MTNREKAAMTAGRLAFAQGKEIGVGAERYKDEARVLAFERGWQRAYERKHGLHWKSIGTRWR